MWQMDERQSLFSSPSLSNVLNTIGGIREVQAVAHSLIGLMAQVGGQSVQWTLSGKRQYKYKILGLEL